MYDLLMFVSILIGYVLLIDDNIKSRKTKLLFVGNKKYLLIEKVYLIDKNVTEYHLPPRHDARMFTKVAWPEQE